MNDVKTCRHFAGKMLGNLRPHFSFPKQNLGRCRGHVVGVWSLVFGAWCLALASTTHAAESGGKILYQNDFSKGEVGKLPDDMLLLDGGFAVQEVSGNKVLQL